MVHCTAHEGVCADGTASIRLFRVSRSLRQLGRIVCRAMHKAARRPGRAGIVISLNNNPAATAAGFETRGTRRMLAVPSAQTPHAPCSAPCGTTGTCGVLFAGGCSSTRQLAMP